MTDQKQTPEPEDSTASNSTPLLCCSFCGKERGAVESMIAGPDVNICNRCVHMCVGILLGCIERDAT